MRFLKRFAINLAIVMGTFAWTATIVLLAVYGIKQNVVAALWGALLLLAVSIAALETWTETA